MEICFCFFYLKKHIIDLDSEKKVLKSPFSVDKNKKKICKSDKYNGSYE